MAGTDQDAAGTSTSAAVADVRRAARGPAIIAGLVVIVALALALLRAGGSARPLDPEAAGRPGAKALASVLRVEGVDVRIVHTVAEAARASAGDAVFVTFPARLSAGQWSRVAGTGADLILLAPGPDALTAVAPTVTVAGGAGDDDTPAPGCSDPIARRAGTAHLAGVTYTAEGAARTCYRSGDGFGLVRVPSADRTVTVVGDGTPFTNDALDEHGNAALTLGLLGARPTLYWYLPSLSDTDPAARKSLVELLPRGLWFGLLQLGVAVLLVALWRGRRLGPVVAEPLPVVVPATETVRGRGRLYRRSAARGPAAAALRAATGQRLITTLALPRGSAPAAVVHAVARRTGRAPDDVGTLLYGPAPTDDAGLVRLANALSDLERGARTP